MSHKNLKSTVDELVEKSGKTFYEISLEFAIKKDGEIPEDRRNKYQRTVENIVKHPERCVVKNLLLVLEILGVNAEAAIAIAASQVQVKSQKPS